MSAQLFDAIAYCPLCGTGNLTRTATSLACGKCKHLEFNNPITAVGVFILDAENRVFLIRRARNPAMGKWGPPGGFLDVGETLEQAAAREVLEETGLVVSDLSYLCSCPNSYLYGGLSRPVCDVFFTARADSSTLKLEQDEVSAANWIALSEIDPAELAFDSMRHALALLRAR